MAARRAAWSEEAAEAHYAEGHLRRDAAELDQMLGSWRQELQIRGLADEGRAIKDRVAAAQHRRPASARPASAAARPGSAGPVPQRRRPASAHPFTKPMSPLPSQPRAAQLAPLQSQQPKLRIPEEFIELLKARAIRKVSLGAQGLRPTDAEVIANFLARDRVVTELALPRNRIGCEGLCHLARSLAGTPVAVLDLSDNDVCHSGWPSQAHVFDADALEELVDSLPETAVAALDLSHNCLTGKDPKQLALQGVHAVARGLAAPAGCPLCRLTLAYNRLGDEGAELLGLALGRRSHSLHTLDLSYCSLLSAPGGKRATKAAGLAQIFKALATNHALRTLDLTGNAIGSGVDELSSGGVGAICGRGVESLSACFEDSALPALTELVLADNGFTYGEECRLALSLLNNQTLQRLNVTPGPLDSNRPGGEVVLCPSDGTQMGVHYIELLAQRDPGGGGKSSPLHWSCRQRSAVCVAIMLWRHPQLLLEMDGYGDTPLDVARTVFDPACIELLERAYQQRISYRGRWVHSADAGPRRDQQHRCEFAMDGESGRRVLLLFFPADERARWVYERDMLRAVAVGDDGAAGDRLIGGLVESFFDESREEAGLPPFCLVLEAGETTLAEMHALRRERQALAERSRFDEYGRSISMTPALTAPSTMKAHAAALASVVFTPAEVRHLARHITETLFHLHSTCRVAHTALGTHSIMRFADGTWRTILHHHAKPFGTVISEAASAPSCPPELAASVLSGALPGLAVAASYDLWGLGALLFELLTGRPLVATAATPFDSERERYDLYARVAAVETAELSSRLVEIGDEEARDFVGLLVLGLGGKRVAAEVLLGKGGGRTQPHRFLCTTSAEANGWLSSQEVETAADDGNDTWVSVPRFSTVADAGARGGAITTYEVVINLPGQPVRSIHRRYAEFKFLLSELLDYVTAPEGGRRSKAFFGWEAGQLEPVHLGPLSPAAAEKRRAGLQRFLQTAADLSDDCARKVLEWLGPAALGEEEAAMAAAEAAAAAEATAAAAAAAPEGMRLGQFQGYPGVETSSVQREYAPSLRKEDSAAADEIRPDTSDDYLSPIRRRIESIYQTHNPSKQGEVDRLMAEWQGREEELLANVEEKYRSGTPSANLGSVEPSAGTATLARPLVEATAAASDLQTQIQALHDSVNPPDDATPKTSPREMPEDTVKQHVKSLLNAQHHITKVLAAQSRRHAADAALPGLNRAGHSAEAEESDAALKKLRLQMDFIDKELAVSSKGEDEVQATVVVSVSWRRLDAALCRLLWLCGGFVHGAHWVPVASHLHRRLKRREAAAAHAKAQRKSAGKYEEPEEPEGEGEEEEEDGGCPFLTRAMLYWLYSAAVLTARVVLTSGFAGGFMPCGEAPTNQTSADTASVAPVTLPVSLTALTDPLVPLAVDVECLYQKQSSGFVMVYVAQMCIASVALAAWLLDGLWLSPLSRQLRRGQRARLSLCVESCGGCSLGMSYVLTCAVASCMVTAAFVHGLLSWSV